MKFGIDCGHGVPYDTGAEGYKIEDHLNRATGNKVMEYLRQLGHEVVDCTPQTASGLGNSLYQRVETARRNNVDLFLSIHYNATPGGQGTEAYCISAKDKAQALCDAIASLGFKNRGVKNGTGLYVVRNTPMPAVLLEVAFVDSQSDMQLLDVIGFDRIGRVVAQALTGQEINSVSNIERKIENMSTLDLQRFLNKLGVTDYEGKALVEDNDYGPRTESAKKKAADLIHMILG